MAVRGVGNNLILCGCYWGEASWYWEHWVILTVDMVLLLCIVFHSFMNHTRVRSWLSVGRSWSLVCRASMLEFCIFFSYSFICSLLVWGLLHSLVILKWLVSQPCVSLHQGFSRRQGMQWDICCILYCWLWTFLFLIKCLSHNKILQFKVRFVVNWT